MLMAQATTCACNIRSASLRYGDKILIADTYNHKIKELDPQTRTVKTLSRHRQAWPGGWQFAFVLRTRRFERRQWQQLYIADTNNHAIRSCRSENKRDTDP